MIMSGSIMACVLLSCRRLAAQNLAQSQLAYDLVLLPFTDITAGAYIAWKDVFAATRCLILIHWLGIIHLVWSIAHSLVLLCYAFVNIITWVWNVINGIWGGTDGLYGLGRRARARAALINNQTGIIAMTHILRCDFTAVFSCENDTRFLTCRREEITGCDELDSVLAGLQNGAGIGGTSS
jgi:putative spermidine/putrescine transport system permease protein